MEDIYLIHTYDSIATDKSIYKSKREELRLKNVLQHSHDNNVLFQLYIKIINFVKEK